MEASVSIITACAPSPVGLRRPIVPSPMFSTLRTATVAGNSNVTCNISFDFHPDVRTFPVRRRRLGLRLVPPVRAAGVPSPPLDLTEDNIIHVLADARVELAQLFDSSVGITGEVQLVDLDGPFVKISLRGRFWHKRSTVLARVGNYLKQRIPEILEVDIEDEKQLDDSPENF